MRLFMEQLLNGVAMGSIYALVTLGLALVYGIMRILHVAHAAVYTVGAYVGLLIFSMTGSLLIAFPGAMIVCAVIGVMIERFVYFPLLKYPPFVPLIASIAILLCRPFAPITRFGHSAAATLASAVVRRAGRAMIAPR